MKQFIKETACTIAIVTFFILMLLPILNKVDYCSLNNEPFIACLIKDAPYQLE